jgi:hypothetical protein
MKKKSITLLNNQIGNIAHKFAIQNKLKLMGSNSFRGFLFPSDYDFTSTITEPIKALSQHLQELFAKPLPFLFLDFKAGTDERQEDKKLRWKPKDLANGYVIIHSKKKTLEEAMKENMLIKLDYAVKLGNSYFENSIIFNTKYQTQKTKNEIENDLEYEIKEYSKQNTMKSLKRLYSLLKLQKKNKPLQDKLVQFFNSDVGLANKIANDLELFELIVETYHLPLQDIIDTTQMIKERLSTIAWINPKPLNTITKSNYKKVIKKEIEHIRTKINPLAKAFLRANM